MESEILELYRSNDPQALQAFLGKLDIDFICSEISKICTSGNGAVVLQVLFNGLTSDSSCQEKRIRIIKSVLENIEKKSVSLRAAEKLLSVLGTQIKFFTATDVICFIDLCLSMLRETKESDVYCWKHLIPQLLNKIEQEVSINHNGTTKSGSEYKSEIVIAICIHEWPDVILTSTASMFVDVNLSPEEHIAVVNKLCSRISSISLQDVPPLIYQMLQLTRERNFVPLFLALAELFDKNLYSQINSGNNFTPGCNVEEVQATEATVLDHICSIVCCLGPQSINDFMKTLKETINAPSFVLGPFCISFLLTISSISYIFEEEILNLLRSAILRKYADDDKRNESAWMETIIPSSVSVDELFDKIILNCSRKRDRILKGLVNLGFKILSTPKILRRTWAFGNSMLVKLMSEYSAVTSSVLQTLADHIFQVDESSKYIDCLFHILRKHPLNVLDCSGVLIQLLDNICTWLPGNVAKRIVTVILPLTKMSESLRDNLIIILRKSLFSSDGARREMAVIGFIELLKNLKISNLTMASQTISQTYCNLSQIYSGTSTGAGASYSNEGLCLELLSLLRAVFKYQHDVKTEFYRGICESVCVNPELGFHVLNNLQNQFHTFFKPGDDIPPLHFDKTVTIQDKLPVLQEPIAHLVFAMGLIVAKMEEGPTKTSRLRDMFDSLCERMSDSDVPHFFLGKELFDGSPESFVKEEEIHQILGVYEALMCYVLSTWTKDSTTHGQKLNSLFRGYSRLSDYARGLGKLDKKKSDKKAKDSKGDEIEEKRRNKNKIYVFRFPTTVLNLRCACRLLSILNEDSVAWATEQSSTMIKSKRELHRYSLNVILTLLKEALSIPGIELSKNKNTLGYLTKIGRIIYIRWVKQVSDMKIFDLQATVTSLECLLELLNLILNHFPEKFPSYLSDIYSGERNSTTGLSTILESMINEILEELQNYIGVFEEEEEASAKEEENLNQKLSLQLIAIATSLASQLPRGAETCNILNKVKRICKERKVSNAKVAKSILAFMTKLYIKSKSSGSLLLDVTLCLCENISLIDDEMQVDSHTAYAVINEQTANECILSVCDSLRDLINEIEWTVTRLKSELLILSVSSQNVTVVTQDELEEKERELCRHINFCMKVLSLLSTIAIPPGKYASAVLREIRNFYHKVTIVTKYFILKVGKYKQKFQNSKFDKTVIMIDHELSKNMYCFTEHVIADGTEITEDNSGKQSKRDPAFLKNTYLRKTKLIPKVIYEKEQFQKFVLQLSKKAKINLAEQTKHALARDYRLHAKQIKEFLAKENFQFEEMEVENEDHSSNESKMDD